MTRQITNKDIKELEKLFTGTKFSAKTKKSLRKLNPQSFFILRSQLREITQRNTR